MRVSELAANFVLAATWLLLARIGWTDLRHYRIGNASNIALLGLFFAYMALSGRMADAPVHIAIAALMFLVTLGFYAANTMGGGDVKLLTIAFLWVGARNAMPFALIMLASTMLHTALVYFGLANAQDRDGRKRIAFGPSIAAALILTLLLSHLSRGD